MFFRIVSVALVILFGVVGVSNTFASPITSGSGVIGGSPSNLSTYSFSIQKGVPNYPDLYELNVSMVSFHDGSMAASYDTVVRSISCSVNPTDPSKWSMVINMNLCAQWYTVSGGGTLAGGPNFGIPQGGWCNWSSSFYYDGDITLSTSMALLPSSISSVETSYREYISDGHIMSGPSAYYPSLEIDGTFASVPEPASLGFLLSPFLLLRRRR